jgi:hypothetical protein
VTDFFEPVQDPWPLLAERRARVIPPRLVVNGTINDHRADMERDFFKG